ncbi:MAG: hypothetical protein RL752_368 [Actinomycetota bacterium]|jgi:hypothetical protein
MALDKQQWIKSSIRYGAISAVALLAIAFYAGEKNPPVLESFSVISETVDLSESGRYEFSGVVTDERGVRSIELLCESETRTEFVILVPTTGSNKYKVSFGRLTASPDWIGHWEGNLNEIRFSGAGKIPLDTPSLTCDWQVKMRDMVGNEITTPAGVVMTVRSR